MSQGTRSWKLGLVPGRQQVPGPRLSVLIYRAQQNQEPLPCRTGGRRAAGAPSTPCAGHRTRLLLSRAPPPSGRAPWDRLRGSLPSGNLFRMWPAGSLLGRPGRGRPARSGLLLLPPTPPALPEAGPGLLAGPQALPACPCRCCPPSLAHPHRLRVHPRTTTVLLGPGQPLPVGVSLHPVPLSSRGAIRVCPPLLLRWADLGSLILTWGICFAIIF